MPRPTVKAKVVANRLVERPKLRLSDMLKRVKRSDIHASVDTGIPVGRELPWKRFASAQSPS